MKTTTANMDEKAKHNMAALSYFHRKNFLAKEINPKLQKARDASDPCRRLQAIKFLKRFLDNADNSMEELWSKNKPNWRVAFSYVKMKLNKSKTVLYPKLNSAITQ